MFQSTWKRDPSFESKVIIKIKLQPETRVDLAKRERESEMRVTEQGINKIGPKAFTLEL